MKYKDSDIIEMLTVSTNDKKLSKKILNDWKNNKANIPLDLTKYRYPLAVISFPIIVDDKEQATFTLVQIHNTGVYDQEDLLMNKYLSPKIYDISYVEFSHDTYMSCYLSINKELRFPESKIKGFYLFESTFKDAEGNDIKYKISYGHPVNDDDIEEYSKYTDKTREYDYYYIFNAGVGIQIESKGIKCYELGEEINKKIKNRVK